MDFHFTPEQEELRRGARRLLGVESSPARVRAAMAREDGCDAALWQRIGRELGWTALAIPETYGGAGLGPVALTAVMEELGRALACVPFFATACLGAGAILAAGSEAQKQRYLPAIAGGEMTATLAVADDGGVWEAGAVTTLARRDGGDFVLSGSKAGVVSGHLADLVVVAARTPESRGERGLSLFALPGAGLTRRALPTMDQTRRVASVALDDVRVPADALLGAEGAGWAAIECVRDAACAALAAEQLGGAERCLELAVEYAKVRVQFGRPIGSFQAVKHRCADMMVAVEAARSASYWAGWAAAHAPSELRLAAPLAKATASEAYFMCASECIQVHGGIGFTWEHDAHLYFKRARASEALLGDASWQRERLAALLGLSDLGAA